MSVRLEQRGSAVVVRIDRPESKNSIDRDTAERVASAMRIASADERVRGVVLTGAGDTFASGGDVNELRALPDDERGADAVLALGETLAAIEACDVPVVAALQGSVYGGGCELVLLCDLVVAAPQAGFAFRHVKMGLTPAWGGLARLVERAGPLAAAQLLYTAEFVTAGDAFAMGLVSEVHDAGPVLDRALEIVERIAQSPRASVAAMKRALRVVREGQRAAPEIERAAFVGRWGSPEHKLAAGAFFDDLRRKNRGYR